MKAGNRLRITLTPFDTCFFRDSKPFEIGGVARSLKQPLPSTLAGALTTLLIEAYGEEYRREEPDWVIRGPLPALVKAGQATALYPLPEDVYELKGRLICLSPSTHPDSPYTYRVAEAEIRTPPRIHQGEVVKPPEEVDLLTQKGIQRYMVGEDLTGEAVSSSDLLAPVERTGVALEWSKVVQFGRLYRLEALEAGWTLEEGRLIRAGFTAKILAEPPLLDRVREAFKGRVLRFGGDSRPSQLYVADGGEDPEWVEAQSRVESRVAETGRFKLYLATPAIFTQGDRSGWFPSWLNEERLEGRFLEEGPLVKLMGVCLGKPVPVSGWDYDRGCVKPMYFGVSAGSVYYFKILEENNYKNAAKTIITLTNLRNVSDMMPRSGFGTALVGVW